MRTKILLGQAQLLSASTDSEIEVEGRGGGKSNQVILLFHLHRSAEKTLTPCEPCLSHTSLSTSLRCCCDVVTRSDESMLFQPTCQVVHPQFLIEPKRKGAVSAIERPPRLVQTQKRLTSLQEAFAGHV